MLQAYFILDNPKRETSTIRGRISYEGVVYEYYTRESVPTAQWSNGSCIPSPGNNLINDRLSAISAAMTNAVLFFKSQYAIPTKIEFRQKVAELIQGKSIVEMNRNERILTAFIDKFSKEWTGSPGTKKIFMNLQGLIEEYEKHIGKKLSFRDIDLRFEKDFRFWLEKRDYTKNYIGTIIKKLKHIMKSAHKIYKLHTSTDYESFSVDSETADTIYLSMKELKRIHELKFPEPHTITTRQMIRVQKTFLIGAIYAMRVSNYSRLADMNITDETVTIMPVKGADLRKPQPITMPMHPIVKEILKSGFRLEDAANETMINTHIKTLCRIAGITEKIKKYQTRGGKLTCQTKEKWQWVTSHTARRSGATNMKLAGMDNALIMVCGGWKSEAMMLKYLKQTIDPDLEKLQKSKYFSNLPG